MRRFAALFIASIIACTFLAMPVPGQVSVANDGPSFVDISIEDIGDMVKVEVLIRDLNGWEDIDTVTLKVLDTHGAEISHIVLEMHYSHDPYILQIRFEELTGSYLNLEETECTYAEIPPWNPDNTDIPIGLDVEFVLLPLEGDTIFIEVADMEGETATYESPMDLNFESQEEESIFGETALILIIIIMMLAIIIILIVLGKGGSKDKF